MVEQPVFQRPSGDGFVSLTQDGIKRACLPARFFREAYERQGTPMIPSATLWAFVLVVVAAVPTSSWGHAVLVESIPPHKATLTASPQTVLLRFNAALERKIIQVYLVDRQKTRTPLADVDESKSNEIVVHPPRSHPGCIPFSTKCWLTMVTSPKDRSASPSLTCKSSGNRKFARWRVAFAPRTEA